MSHSGPPHARAAIHKKISQFTNFLSKMCVESIPSTKKKTDEHSRTNTGVGNRYEVRLALRYMRVRFKKGCRSSSFGEFSSFLFLKTYTCCSRKISLDIQQRYILSPCVCVYIFWDDISNSVFLVAKFSQSCKMCASNKTTMRINKVLCATSCTNSSHARSRSCFLTVY